MIKKKLILLSLGILPLQSVLIAQTVNSAVEATMYDVIGSGRYVSMGGAFTAVGGDLSAIKINPAAAGMKKTDEYAVSADFSMYQFESTANGASQKANMNRFSIPDFTYVSVQPTNDLHWKAMNFSLGFQRLNNLNSSVNFSGKGRFKSYINTLRDDAQTLSDQGYTFAENSIVYQAYQTVMIDKDEKGNYYSMLEQDGQEFSYEYESTGKIYEMFLSVSSAYQNKLFVGATLAFPIYNQSTSSYLREYNFLYPKTDLTLNGVPTQLVSAHFQQDHNVTGSGVVGKFGLIYRVDKNIRLGASYHTPTYYNLEDNFSYETTAYFKNYATQRIEYGGGALFNMITPAHYNLGFAYIFGKKGLLSVDYNYTNISGTEYIVPTTDINYNYFNGDKTLDGDRGINDLIREDFKGSHTIKVGGELNAKPMRFRAGAAIQTSPYNSGNSLQSVTVSGGMGYSKKEFFIDFGASYRMSEAEVNLNAYSGPEGNSSEKINQLQLVLTVGRKLK